MDAVGCCNPPKIRPSRSCARWRLQEAALARPEARMLPRAAPRPGPGACHPRSSLRCPRPSRHRACRGEGLKIGGSPDLDASYGKAPSLGARENEIRSGSSCEGISDVLKASERKHFFNWQGTLRRNRRLMVSSVQRQYKTSNAADARYYLSPRGNGFDGDGASFQDAVTNSAFTLCPCGNNAETHRLWEALLAGLFLSKKIVTTPNLK